MNDGGNEVTPPRNVHRTRLDKPEKFKSIVYLAVTEYARGRLDLSEGERERKKNSGAIAADFSTDI